MKNLHQIGVTNYLSSTVNTDLDLGWRWQSIEGVQRRATKLVQGIELWKYENRLAYLRLPRLDMRRVRCDLIDTFKIMNSIYDVHSELFFHLDEGGRRGHEKKLFKKDLD